MVAPAPTSLGTRHTSNGSVTSLSLSIQNAITSGNMVLVIIGIDNNGSTPPPTVLSVSDGINTYAKVYGVTQGDVRGELWACYNAQPVAQFSSITVNISTTIVSSGGSFDIVAGQAAWPSAIVDVAASAIAEGDGTSGSLQVVSGTLAQATELAIYVHFGGGGNAGGSAWTIIDQGAGIIASWGYIDTTTTSSLSFTDSNITDHWIASITGFEQITPSFNFRRIVYRR